MMKRFTQYRPTSKPAKPVLKSQRPAVPVSAPFARGPQLRILLIGNNYCGTSNELFGCFNDILAVKEFVLSFADKRYGEPMFYILGDDRVQVAQNGKGTGENILKGIHWLVSGVMDGDSLIVHYSGHGVAISSGLDANELNGVDSAWVPTDYLTFRGGGRNGFIIDNELRRLLADSIPTGVKLWLTSDSCHSGSVLDLRYNYTDASFAEKILVTQDVPDAYNVTLPTDDGTTIRFNSKALRTVTSVAEIKGYAKTAGSVIMLSGCADTQTAADAYALSNTTKPMGALTWAFLTVLKKQPDTPLKYLMKDIRALLKLSKFTQTPQLSSGQPLDITLSSLSFQACALSSKA
jgi:hypothetical protein